jgi:anti-sigma B factor antagonist
MDIVVNEIKPHTKTVQLSGRLDHKGSGEIELRFTALTATNSDNIAVDMAGVDFIASIGMRLLLSCAKAKAARGGRMVLFGLQPLVLEAMASAGIDTLIPIHADQPAALADLPA